MFEDTSNRPIDYLSNRSNNLFINISGSKMAWTDDRVKILETMWLGGNSASEIAAVLDVTRNAVIGKANRMGLSGRQSPIKGKKGGKKTAAKKAVKGKAKSKAKTIKGVKAKSKAKEKEEEVVDENKVFGLLDLNERTCRWPFNDPRNEDFYFCGKACTPGLIYCDEHRAMAYQQGTSRAKPKKKVPAKRG